MFHFYFSFSHILEEILRNDLDHRLSPTFPSRGEKIHFISAFRARLLGKVVTSFAAPAVISSDAQIRLLEPRGLIHLINVTGQSYILYCVWVRITRRLCAGINSAQIEYNYLWLKLKICFIHEKSQMDLETEIIESQTTHNLKLKVVEIHTEAQQLQRGRFKRWRSKWLMSKNRLGSTPRCFSGDPDSYLTPLFSLWTQHFQGDWPSASSLTPPGSRHQQAACSPMNTDPSHTLSFQLGGNHRDLEAQTVTEATSAASFPNSPSETGKKN